MTQRTQMGLVASQRCLILRQARQPSRERVNFCERFLPGGGGGGAGAVAEPTAGRSSAVVFAGPADERRRLAAVVGRPSGGRRSTLVGGEGEATSGIGLSVSYWLDSIVMAEGEQAKEKV